MRLLGFRSRFVRLGAGGLVLSGLLPLAAAEPPHDEPPPGEPPPGAVVVAPPTVSRWEAFWDQYRKPCETIPSGAIPYPLGTHVHALEGRMAQRAAEDQFVVYQHEWYKGGVTLGPNGGVHLARIATLLPHCPARVILQPEPAPALNESRRLLLVRLLQDQGVADADQRVVVDFPIAEGMSADEAARFYSRGHGSNIGGQGNGINAGYGNPLLQGALTPLGGGFLGGFRGGLYGGYTGY